MRTGLLVSLCFLAGVLAPPLVCFGDTPANSSTNQLALLLKLTDGSSIFAQSKDNELTIIGETVGTIRVPLSHITTIKFGDEGKPDTVIFKNQDKLRGDVHFTSLGVETVLGQISVAKKLLVEIQVTRENGAAQDGLVLWYSFDADEGEKVSDRSGHNNNGQVDGATYEAVGETHHAYRFLRGQGQIRALNSPHWNFGTNPFSMALWISLETLPHREKDVFMIAHDEGGGNRNKWGFEFFHDELSFYLSSPALGEHRIAAFKFKPETNRWYHLLITRDGDKFGIYIDGQPKSADESPLAVPNAMAELTIGATEDVGIDGRLSDIRIYNRTLSPVEIKALYDSQK